MDDTAYPIMAINGIEAGAILLQKLSRLLAIFLHGTKVFMPVAKQDQ
jgi:hypothetical protein